MVFIVMLYMSWAQNINRIKYTRILKPVQYRIYVILTFKNSIL